VISWFQAFSFKCNLYHYTAVIPTRFKLLWVDMVEIVWVTYLSLVANSRRKETRDVVQEVVDASRGKVQGGTAAAAESSAAAGAGEGSTEKASGSFLEQRRATVALRALAERVESLRSVAAEGAAERAEARERVADGLSVLGPGMGSAGPDRYQGEFSEASAVFEFDVTTTGRPNVTVSNDAERGLTEVQIAGAERPGWGCYKLNPLLQAASS
jgi:hypothetical protein